MEPILRINRVKSADNNLSEYEIIIMQGTELINSENALLDSIKDTAPSKKGIVEVLKISNNTWRIKSNK